MKFVHSIILFLIGFWWINPNPLISQTNWNTFESPPFRIYYLDSDKIYTKELSALFQTAYLDLVNKLGFELVRPVTIYICPSEKIFNNLTGNFIPDWGEGVADPIQSLIILKSPDLTDNYKRLPKLVRHELTHILIGHSVEHPQILPTWFNEGMAIYLSADEEFTGGKAISKALISDSIIPLDEIDEVLKFQQAKARLAYEESYSFTLYLVETYGFDTIAQLIRELNSGKTFDQAFQDIFETDLFEVEINWYEYIGKKYRWHFLLDFETFLWIFILFLFIFVFIAIRWRNRKTMKRWDEEERLANF